MAKNKNNKGPSKASTTNSSSSLSDLKSYSQNLSDSASSIRSAAQIYNNVSNNNNKVLSDSLSQLHKTLSSFSESFGKVMKDVGRSSTGGQVLRASVGGGGGGNPPDETGNTVRDRIRQAFTDGSDEFSNAFGEQGDKLVSNGQLLIKTFEKVAMRVFDYFNKKLETGFYTIVDSYNAHFTEITVRMNQSAQEYTNMLMQKTSDIISAGLKVQFSQKDFQEALVPVLETGIRGETAQEMAFRNMISSKLLPMIQNNTKSYSRMSKTLGDNFTDMTNAMGLYTEQMYGAEGLEEGRADALLEQTYREILLAANGDKDKASENWGKIMETYQNLSNNVSKDYADYWLDQFTAAAHSEVDNVVAMTTLGDTGVRPGDLTALIDNLDSFTSNLEGTVKNFSRGDAYSASYMAQAGVEGLNLAAMQDLLIYDQYGPQGTGNGKEDKNAGSMDWARQQQENAKDDLASGKYQSVTAQQEKKYENDTAKIADIAAEYIPDVKNTLGTIFGVIKDIFGLLMAWKVGEGLFGNGGQGGLLKNLLGGGNGEGGGGLLKNLLGGNGGTSALQNFFGGSGGIVNNANAAAELFNGGASFSEVASVGGKGSALLGKIGSFGGSSTLSGGLLNLAAGPGALIVGGAMMAADAWKAGSKLAEDGAGVDKIIGAGARAALTGRQTMTSSEKLDATEAALRGEKRKMDWKAVGINALKGGALGAGIGTAAGGWAAGIGTAVGAGVGAITGAVASMIDQAIENAKYNKLAEATEQATEAFDKLSQSQGNYAETIKKGEDYQKLANELLEIKNSGDEDQIALAEENFKLLQDAYPDQLGKLKDLSEFDEKYIEVINNKIERENILAAQQMKSDTQDALNAAEEVFSKFNDITSGSDLKSQASLDFIDAVLATGGENGDTWSADKINETLRDVIKNNYGLEEGDEGYQDQFNALVAELNSGESGEVLHLGDNGEILGLRGQKGHGATSGDNMAQFKEDYGDSSEKRKQAAGVIDEYKTNILKAWNSLAMMAEANQDPDTGDFNFSEGQKQEAKEIADSLAEKISGVRGKAEEYGLDYKVFSKDDFPGIEDIYKAVGSQLPSFKVGSYEIPYDDFIAKLHEGEMVLTKQDADTLRGIVKEKSKSGVSEFLTYILDSFKGKDKDDKAKSDGGSIFEGLFNKDSEEEPTSLFGKLFNIGKRDKTDEDDSSFFGKIKKLKNKVLGISDEETTDSVVDEANVEETVTTGDQLSEIISLLKDHFGVVEADESTDSVVSSLSDLQDELIKEKQDLISLGKFDVEGQDQEVQVSQDFFNTAAAVKMRKIIEDLDAADLQYNKSDVITDEGGAVNLTDVATTVEDAAASGINEAVQASIETLQATADQTVKSSNANEEESVNFDPVVDAINHQTEVISKINNNILSLLVNMSKSPLFTDTTLTEELITYKRA